MRGTRRWLRLGLAAASLGLATVAAPLASSGLGTAAHAGPSAAAAQPPHQCITGHDYGSGASALLCVYDDAKGYRFGRITYNSPQVSTNMHSLAVSLYRCQTGGRNCSLMDYNFAENSYLPAGKSMTVSTGKVKAQYGWVYQACGGVNATLLSTPPQREWNWGDCTKFIPGAPRVSVIVGPPGV